MKILIPRLPDMPSARTDDVARLLNKIAEKAGKNAKLDIFLPNQHDAAYMWGDAAIHPMQALETGYRTVVKDAEREAVGEDAKREAQLKQLSLFFQFDVDQPKTMAESILGTSYTSLEDMLNTAERDVAMAVNEQKLLSPSSDRNHSIKLRRLIAYLRDAFVILRDGLYLFRNSDGELPDLLATLAPIVNIPYEIQRMKTKEEFEAYVKIARNAIKRLRTALNGAASIQNFHVIDTFYLYRLLVGYKIQTKGEATTDQRKEASKYLTALMNNDLDSVINFLKNCLNLINIRLQYIDEENILFFLKGGRAMKYLLGEPDKGENDWDTSIVINPYLPSEEWYTLYARVHNEMVYLLTNFKVDFYNMLYANRKEINTSLNLPLDPDALGDDAIDLDEVQESWPNVEGTIGMFDTASCKAELIDIGIPRRDSIQAREQWTHLKGKILLSLSDGIPYPNYPYYLDEYLMMIRSEFAGDSHSSKTPKRVRRLIELLNSDGIDSTIKATVASLPDSLAEANADIEGEFSGAEYRVLVYILSQFSIAYDFANDARGSDVRSLASAFNIWFIENCKPLLQPTLPRSFIKATRKDKNWEESDMLVANAVGFAQQVSDLLSKQIQDQATMLVRPGHGKSKTPSIEAMIKDCVINDLLPALAPYDPNSKGVLMATGPYAAIKQAQRAGNSKMADFVPAAATQFSLVGYNRAELRKSLESLAGLIEGNLSISSNFELVRTRDKIQLYTKADMQIGDFQYAPIVLNIVLFVLTDENVPRTDYIDGIAVLGLPDLIRQLQQQAAEKVEYGMQSALYKTCDALSNILTKYEDPVPKEAPSYIN